MFTYRYALFGAMVVVLPHIAHATAYNAKTILDNFNLIDFGNLSVGSESEGRVWVGGNLSGTLTNVGFGGGTSSFGKDSGLTTFSGANTLTVDGSVAAGTSLTVNNGGITVGGSVGTSSSPANVTLNGAAGTKSLVGGNFYANATIDGSSSSPASLQYGGSAGGGRTLNNATVTHNGSIGAVGVPASTFAAVNGLIETKIDGIAHNGTISQVNIGGQPAAGYYLFTGPSSGNVAVFELSDAFLSAVSQISFSLSSNINTVYINVDGNGAASYGANVIQFGSTPIPSDLANILVWNFNKSTSLTIGSEIYGSVLAPDAAVTQTSNIDGSLVAGSLLQSAELHSYVFTGSFPSLPEPPGVAIMATGLAMLGVSGLLMRRRDRRG